MIYSSKDKPASETREGYEDLEWHSLESNSTKQVKQMTRKLIQIVDCPDSPSAQGCIYGLCNDGTLWAFTHGSWHIVSNGVPQGDEDDN